jgi:hypothetical protein
MDDGGLDGHPKPRQMCRFTAAGALLHQRIETHRERCAAGFAGRPTARLLLKASPERAGGAQCWEALGQGEGGLDHRVGHFGKDDGQNMESAKSWGS